MRLKILLTVLVLVTSVGSYYYGYNTGSNDERLFSKGVILPLCVLITPNNKESLVECLQENL